MARPRLLTDDEILAATQSCLFEYGPSVSTTMIAERAGISQAALFKRFGTKERLIISALRQPMQRNPIVDRLEMGPQAGPIRAQLIELGVAMIGVMRRVVPCLAMLHSAGLSLPDEDGHETRPSVRVRVLLAEWLQQAIDAGRIQSVDPQIMAVGYLGMLHSRPFREVIIGDTDLTCTDEQYVTQLVDSFIDGIAVSEAS